MFQKGYEIASNYTFPLIIAIQYFDKTVESGLGSFVVLNDEGWIITCAHNLSAYFAFNEHQEEIKKYNDEKARIEQNPGFKPHKKNDLLRRLKTNQKWVINYTILFAGKTVTIHEIYIYGEVDIALIRIDKNEIADCKIFPRLRKVEKLKVGLSLCKIGFPLFKPNITFDEVKKTFVLPPDLFPIPRFPMEGIYTRDISFGKTTDGLMDKLYIETSSPGLKGQSGGPIIDTEGNICAIQSKNWTLDLGFKGKITINNKEVEENQFINLGMGVHPKIIIELLDKHKIKYELSE